MHGCAKVLSRGARAPPRHGGVGVRPHNFQVEREAPCARPQAGMNSHRYTPLQPVLGCSDLVFRFIRPTLISALYR